jgi:hypothetical protein
MRSVELDGSWIHIEAVFKGLVSEEGKVQAGYDAVRPEVLGISMSKEGLAALRMDLPESAYDLSEQEHAYKALMGTFGAVKLPTPAYLKALAVSQQTGTPIIPLDMNDDLYTQAFCEAVGGLDLVREGMVSKKLKRKRFDISSPEAFVRDWERKVNRISGFQRLELAREAHMASALGNLGKKYRVVLALIEYERAEGVAETLRKMAERRA